MFPFVQLVSSVDAASAYRLEHTSCAQTVLTSESAEVLSAELKKQNPSRASGIRLLLVAGGGREALSIHIQVIFGVKLTPSRTGGDSALGAVGVTIHNNFVRPPGVEWRWWRLYPKHPGPGLSAAIAILGTRSIRDLSLRLLWHSVYSDN